MAEQMPITSGLYDNEITMATINKCDIMFAFTDNDVDVAYFLPAAAAILPPTNLALLVRSRYAMYRILKISCDIKKN